MRLVFTVNIYCVEDVKKFHKYLPWDPENPIPCVKGKVFTIDCEMEGGEEIRNQICRHYEGNLPEEGWFSQVIFKTVKCHS